MEWLWLLALIPGWYLLHVLIGMIGPPKYLGMGLLMKELRNRGINPHTLGRECLEAHVKSAILFAKALKTIREKPFRVAMHDRIVEQAHNIAEVMKGIRKPDATIDAILMHHSASVLPRKD